MPQNLNKTYVNQHTGEESTHFRNTGGFRDKIKSPSEKKLKLFTKKIKMSTET